MSGASSSSPAGGSGGTRMPARGARRGRAPLGAGSPGAVTGRRGAFRKVVADLGLLTLSALLFALSFPSFLSDWGWFPLGFLCLAPLFIAVHRATWPATPLYGLFFGYVSYALFNFWLGKFHPLTLVVVPPIYAAYFLALVPALKLADTLFPVYAFLPQAALWVCYEYFLKSSGFLAYQYGNMGYSQYPFLPLVRTSSLFGVWGVSFLTVLPSAVAAGVLRDGLAAARRRLRRFFVPALITAVLLGAAVIYGVGARVDLSAARGWKVALVQQNVDPWKGGYAAYAESLEASIRQSERALAARPEIVIWSETSFVPAIEWHSRYRTDAEIYGLVRKLLDYLARQPVPFVIGNDDGQLKRAESGEDVRVDYNASILFDSGRRVATYRKLRLVPFTESFPFQKGLPFVYAWLKSADTHFWEQGTDPTVYTAGGVRFSTPICFEDTFGDLCSLFVRRGADVLVNMTNDAWSFSVPGAVQHMAMAVFRAAENRRSVVRSTNAGITCIIDPNGRITARLPAFTEGALVGEVPVLVGGESPYTRLGDWFPWVLLSTGVPALLLGGVRALRRRRVSD